MKTNINLKSLDVIVNDGEMVETIAVKNPSQMWKEVKKAIANYGHDVKIQVFDVNDNMYMNISVRELKNGKFYMVNSVVETRRSQIVAAKMKAAKKIEEERIAAKKAKKAEYDRQRRARLKAAKAETASAE